MKPGLHDVRSRALAAWPMSWVYVVMWAAALLMPASLEAITMRNDPEGFRGIQWGSPLRDIETLVLVESWQHVREYEFKDGPLHLGNAHLESVKLSSIGGAFARVTIRYQGEETHEQVVAYLQSRFGPIERMPGSMMRGLSQTYTWRGPETQINLTYQGMGTRGFIFIESRTFAARFIDMLPEHAY